ncbi:MAG: amidohydrolase/deacetylase family metallohydrolase [Minicystis sp.]
MVLPRSIRPAALALVLAACGPRAAIVGPPEGAPPADAGSHAEAIIPDAAPPLPGDDAVTCDLLLRHGHLVDPASGRDGTFDIAVTGDRIVKIAPTIAPDHAATVIDATGLFVTPGLVDLHVHVFHGPEADNYLSNSPLAAVVDEAAPRSCTTTVVDAGSSGHRTFATFEQQIIQRAQTRVLALLNIVGYGMRGGRFEQDLGDMSAEATAAAITAHRASIVGIKVAHYAGPGWEPVDRAVAAGRRAGVPVMVDFGGHVPELSMEELLLHRLRPGDLLTHLYASVRGRTAVVDERGRVRPYMRPAHDRGILFDLGYGGASFVFSQAVPAIRQGLLPDTVSTDMHRSSLRGSMHDLVSVMSKLHALGMEIPDLIRRTTMAPAGAIHRPELGRLAEGGEADIAVMGLEKGRFVLSDTSGARMEGSEQLTCELTVRAGRVLWDPKKRAAPR